MGIGVSLSLIITAHSFKVFDMEKDGLEITFRNGLFLKPNPYGIRNKNGFLLFFPKITKFSGQEDRYIREVTEQNQLAWDILEFLKQ